MKKNNHRKKNHGVKNNINRLVNLKNKYDWPTLKATIIAQYSKKPSLFIGSIIGFLFVSFLLLSLNETDESFNLSDENPIVMHTPENDNRPIDENFQLNNNKTAEEVNLLDISSSDSPLNEDELTAIDNTHSPRFFDMENDSDLVDAPELPLEPITGINLKQNANFVADKPKAISIAPATQKEVPQKSKPIRKAVKSWVFKKNPEHYTIQLVAGKNKNDIDKFLKTNKKVKRISYFQTVKQGQSWYVVVHSTFKNFSDAEKALKKLPRSVAKNNPWIRPYASIQKDIIANAEKLILINSTFANVD